MKRSLKDRIAALGLSYQKEMMMLILIVVVSIGLALLSYFFLKQLYISIFAGLAGVVAIYFFLTRYSSMERAIQKEHIDQLISLLTYFEIFLSNGNNVYTSFRMLLPYADEFLQEAISSMLAAIDVDKTIGPYISFEIGRAHV